MSSVIAQLLDHFKALADPVRLRLFVLCASAECSVSELKEVTGLSQPRVSQHLKQLTEAGLIERFRDGQFVYYRVGTEGKAAVERRRLLALIPPDEVEFTQDLEKLMALRGQGFVNAADSGDRALNRALVELTMSAPLGNLLDIGSGEGRVLTLLASRAHRAVGVDTDPDARRHARRELLFAGLPNCTVRQGSMYDMPFSDAEFDTVVVDDVLGDARDPVAALREASRLVKRGGRLVVIGIASDDRRYDVVHDLADWCNGLGLMVGEPRQLTNQLEFWFLAVARHAPTRSVAA
jgi:ArsR family transcriptional regulator